MGGSESINLGTDGDIPITEENFNTGSEIIDLGTLS